MKRSTISKIILALIMYSVLVSCDLFKAEKFANVIMIEGPKLEDAGGSFSYVGRVQNIGNGRAKFVIIYVSIYDFLGNPMITAYGVADKTHLDPGENSGWRVTIDDADFEIRDLMDHSRTIYDIDWSDED